MKSSSDQANGEQNFDEEAFRVILEGYDRVFLFFFERWRFDGRDLKCFAEESLIANVFYRGRDCGSCENENRMIVEGVVV